MEYTKICKCGCGEHPILMVHRKMGTYSYFCPDCGDITSEYVRKEDAVEAWNRGERSNE